MDKYGKRIDNKGLIFYFYNHYFRDQLTFIFH